MTLLSIDGVTKSHGDRVLLRDVTLMIGDEERVGLVGPNGGGKSTLMRILAGLDQADAGTRIVRRDLRLGYLEQEPTLDGNATAREVVRAGLVERERVLRDLAKVHDDMAKAHGEALEKAIGRASRLEAELERLGGHDVEHKVESTLEALGLPDPEARCGTMSGGERRRVALARLLLAGPELLLLDEPTNHLDALVTDWLEDWFLETRTPLLLVTHDRYFLDRVCDRIVELDRGELFSYQGGYGDYLEKRADRLESERRAEGSRLNLLRRETAWMRRGAPARTTKQKARIRRFEQTVSAVPIALTDDLEFQFPAGPRLGARVLKLEGVSKRFGERVVVPKLDLELAPGTRLGIVGPNGAGKSTLVRMLLGELAPDTGSRSVGETVKFASVDQMRSGVQLDVTVLEELAGRSDVVKIGERVVRAESYLDRFGFDVSVQRNLVRQLSGGERNRLMLAKLMLQSGNVLVLDEPTNDLDLQTLRALEEALLAFDGAAVLVSHDRWFLDRVATQVLYLDGTGRARLHHGDMSGLLELLAKEREAERAARSEKPAAKAKDSDSKAAPAAKKRITPWQLQELEKLEGEIPRLEAELVALDAELADPAIYAGPRAALEAAKVRRTALEATIKKAYARWEELEALRS
ncbi:MAG: ATP-binding cassette domain-containing protein [Planctomycetota bacterium]|nr:ATP-binding cassette domain-containing protein [Planctomycetota bacterium]